MEVNGDEGQRTGEVRKRVINRYLSLCGHLRGHFLQSHFGVRRRTGFNGSGDEAVQRNQILRIEPQKRGVKVDRGRFFRRFNGGEGQELSQEWGLVRNGVPNRMDAFVETDFTKRRFVGVPCIVPSVGVKLLVHQKRGQLKRRVVWLIVDDLFSGGEPVHVARPTASAASARTSSWARRWCPG